MKKTFDFGKIAWRGKRKINRVTVDVELSEDRCDNGPTFSACANVWNNIGSDIVAGGQVLDELVEHLKDNKVFMEIHRLWKANHMNDMHAGTPEQEKCVEEHRDEIGRPYDYGKACEVLKKYGLYEVPKAGGGTYKYGTAWLYWPIPEDDLEKAKALLS